MRGRAAGAALPALVVLVLVAVVAVAATGSVATGSSESRRPSDTLLDMLFTLWIVAVLAGGVLLVYGLTQRQAIAKQIARGGYPRFTVTSFLVFAGFLAFMVLAFSRWRPRGFDPTDEETVFGPGTSVPTAPQETAPIGQYEPGLNWVPLVMVAGLVVAAAVAYVAATRRARRPRDPQAALAEDLATALDDALDDLRAEADPRRAIIAAYARLERVLAANGVARLPSETADEYLVRVLHDLELTPDSIGRLTSLFTQAKFSHHAVDSTMKESAIAALEQVRDELRSLRDAPTAPDPPAPEAVTS